MIDPMIITLLNIDNLLKATMIIDNLIFGMSGVDNMNEDIKNTIYDLIDKNELQEAKLKALEYHRYLINEHSDLQMTICNIMLREGDLEGAEKMLIGLLKTDPGNYKLLSTLGDIAQSKNDFYSARAYYSLAKKNCGDFKEIERLSNIIFNLEPAVTDIRNSKKLVILDNYFPNVKAGFRVAEFNYYLNKYPNCEIYSSDSNFHIILMNTKTVSLNLKTE